MDGVGVLRSTDDGEHWTTSSDGLSNHHVVDMLLDSDDVLYTALYYHPTMRSADAGHNWEQIDDSRRVSRRLAIGADGTLYCARDRDGVYVSTDRGTSWQPRKAGMSRAGFRALCVSPTGHLFAAMTDRPHYHFPPGSDRWLEFGAPLEDAQIRGFLATRDRVFAFTESDGVYWSSDDGNTWAQCPGKLATERVFSMAEGQDGLYAGLTGELLRSTDDGESWERFGPETEAAVNGISFTPDGLPVLATWAKGVLQFHLGGGWMPVNDGLPQRFDQPPGVDEVLVDGRGIIYALMDWHGLFRLGEPAAAAPLAAAIANVPRLYQNYPNPFNPVTGIRYDIAEYAHVRISVFDALGRKITTLVDEVLAPGTYQVEFDASTQPSGTYICRLECGGNAQSMCMTLIR
jgi:photosystem II stability/assembly factor-like uncharacterized protein